MKAYYDTLVKKYSKLTITYVDYENALKMQNIFSYISKSHPQTVSCFDPTDHTLLKKIKLYIPHINVLPSPNFIVSPTQMQTYRDKQGNKASRHKAYYTYVKQLLNILVNTPSQDASNRESLHKNSHIDIPPSSYHKMNKYYKEAIQYANSPIFSNHFGYPNEVTRYPITSKSANIYFYTFLKSKFINFGKYQDAIVKQYDILFHSNISAALNIGLLNPIDIVKKTKTFAETHDIPINSYEGFIRQLLGWREYCRYTYVYFYEDMLKSNLPNNTKVIKDWRSWREGTTGIAPIDEEIKKVSKTGYAHHIVRLMIFLNFFILSGIRPQDIYKWFMENICIDAYDWVMVFNIWGMGYFYKHAMTKPYISTSHYIVKMSDYKKDGVWDTMWDRMFYDFIKSRPSAYVGVYKRNLS
jgi:deoxyribodipyrimidine photolyase-related protein